MKIKLNLTQKFLGPTLIILVIFGVVLVYQTNATIRRGVIGNAQNNIADFVGTHTKRHVASSADFSPVDSIQATHVFGELLEDIKTSDIIRIKVWDKDGTVIFADDKSIIGRSFKENENFQKSIRGEIAVVIKAPLDPENREEKGYKQLMEVYVPIELRAGEGVVGVVETYYKLDRLNVDIAKAQREISMAISLGFLLLALLVWFLMRFIVIKPLKSLEAGIKKLRERERE